MEMEIKDLTIGDVVQAAHDNAVRKGFWKRNNIGEKLMLIVSELGEAMEAHRKGDLGLTTLKKDSFRDEIADAFIRLADLCGEMDLDIEEQIIWKMNYNKNRPRLHGKKY